MFDGIVMDVVAMTLEIDFIPDQVLPVTTLPDATTSIPPT